MLRGGGGGGSFPKKRVRRDTLASCPFITEVALESGPKPVPPALISGLSLNCRLGQWPSLGSVPKTVCLRTLSLWLLSRKIHPPLEDLREVFQGSGWFVSNTPAPAGRGG